MSEYAARAQPRRRPRSIGAGSSRSGNVAARAEALVDRKDQHHRAVLDAYDNSGDEWLLPWAILPEVDSLLGAHVGTSARDAFLADLADGAYAVAWGEDARPVASTVRRLRPLSTHILRY